MSIPEWVYEAEFEDLSPLQKVGRLLSGFVFLALIIGVFTLFMLYVYPLLLTVLPALANN